MSNGGMTISDWVMVSAVILGPILAIQIEKFLEIWKENRNIKLWIFKTLMRTRGSPLLPLHIEALNMIELEFYPRDKFKNVVDTWKIYHDHLNNFPKDQNDRNNSAEINRWTEKKNNLLVDLLFEMSKVLKYDFDKVNLSKGVYTPQGHADAEWEQVIIRKSLTKILQGKNAIPVSVIEEEAKRS